MSYNSTAQLSTNQHYENPIPGRDFILSLFGKMKKKLSREQIARALGLNNSEQKEALRRRLRAMERDGQLTFSQRDGYQLIDPAQLIDGVVSIHPDGFGFVHFSDTEKDLYLHKTQLTHVINGDVVQVLLDCETGKRSNHKLISIVERKTTQLSGILKRQGCGLVLIPDDHKISHKIVVQSDSLLGAKTGQYVNTNITDYPNHRQTMQVQIIEVLGYPNAVGMDTKLALRRHGISDQWDQRLIGAAETFGQQVLENDKASRTDYRDLPFVTIDGADAKDFDDAVFCEQTSNGNWRLLVAIADVSHYVKPNDILDVEAQARGTSIYCPGQVIPMLPEALSNGLCSLNPHEDRLVMVCELFINRDGVVKKSTFTEGVIHSHARLTYDQAHAIVAKPRSNLARKVTATNAGILIPMQNLHALYKVLSVARSKRGAIEFDTQELKLNLNKNLKIASIEPVERNDAHRMIEEFMLCANVATAQFLDQHKIPGLFRVHAGPQSKKLISLRGFLAAKGLKLGGGDKPTSQHYNALLEKIKSRPDAKTIRMLLLRSQSQAEYSANNQGHFGLAYDAYAHFTSPIRRYPDLVTHRAIRAKLHSKDRGLLQKAVDFLHLDSLARQGFSKKAYPYSFETIKSLSAHCSEQSRQADDIGREVEAALKCQYMEEFIGNSFQATVSGVAGFGFFVELDETGIEGLVPLSSFSQGEFVFDAAAQNLVHGKQRISLGDSVTVVLKTVDLRQRKMDFLLLGDQQSQVA